MTRNHCPPIPALLVLGVIAVAMPSIVYGEDKSETQSEAEAMINSLVAISAPPEFARNTNGIPPRFDVIQLPLFASDFNWKNQESIRTAIAALGRSESLDTWDLLLVHLDDKRYCITFRQSVGEPHNYTVGSICLHLAHQRLNGVFLSSLGLNDVDLPIQIDYKTKEFRNLREWRRKRSGHTFAQLQSEVGRMVIAAVPKVKHLSDARREGILVKLRSQVEQIESDGIPRFVPFWKESYVVYTAEDAKAIRLRLNR